MDTPQNREQDSAAGADWLDVSLSGPLVLSLTRTGNTERMCQPGRDPIVYCNYSFLFKIRIIQWWSFKIAKFLPVKLADTLYIIFIYI